MSELTLVQLRHFVAVATALHFSRAAQRVGIQPAQLKRQLRDLEREIGVRLLWRAVRCVRLTSDGEVLLADAERALSLMGDSEGTSLPASQLFSTSSSPPESAEFLIKSCI
jgi:DNA-binding transcriptional LysR family regulator